LPWPSGAVFYENKLSSESARQSAGHTTLPALNYHQWLFIGDEKMIAQIKKALEV